MFAQDSPSSPAIKYEQAPNLDKRQQYDIVLKPRQEEAEENKSIKKCILQQTESYKEVFIKLATIQFKIAQKFSPCVFGLGDLITDIIYFTQLEEHTSLMTIMFVFFLFVSLLIQTLIWTTFELLQDTDDNIKVGTLLYYIKNPRSKPLHWDKSIVIISCQVFGRVILLILRLILCLLKQFLFSILSEVKVLAILRGYNDSIFNKVKYTISEDLIQLYKQQEYIFQNGGVVKESQQQEAKRLIPEGEGKLDQILDNAIYSRYIYASTFVPTVFRSKIIHIKNIKGLPMILIQFSINTFTDNWSSNISIISFTMSLVQVLSLIMNFFYQLHKETIGPIYSLRKYYQNYSSNELFTKKDWIVGQETRFYLYEREEQKYKDISLGQAHIIREMVLENISKYFKGFQKLSQIEIIAHSFTLIYRNDDLSGQELGQTKLTLNNNVDFDLQILFDYEQFLGIQKFTSEQVLTLLPSLPQVIFVKNTICERIKSLNILIPEIYLDLPSLFQDTQKVNPLKTLDRLNIFINNFQMLWNLQTLQLQLTNGAGWEAADFIREIPKYFPDIVQVIGQFEYLSSLKIYLIGINQLQENIKYIKILVIQNQIMYNF